MAKKNERRCAFGHTAEKNPKFVFEVEITLRFFDCKKPKAIRRWFAHTPKKLAKLLNFYFPPISSEGHDLNFGNSS